MKPTEENPPDAGFTLIEALVVLTITALAIALVPATVSLGQRALQVAANLEHTTSDHRAREALTARIEAARPIFQTDAAGLSTLVFEGRPDRMRFVSEFSDGPAGGGLYVADLGLDPSNSTLVLSLTPYPTRANATPSTVTRLQPAALLSLRYFGPDAETGNRIWQSSWVATSQLPEMIELTIQRTADDANTTLSIIALRLAQN
jgi:prepilin-type N-terminal cleavage/methylation domain-containing protein